MFFFIIIQTINLYRPINKIIGFLNYDYLNDFSIG